MKKTVLSAIIALALTIGMTSSVNAEQKIATIDIQKIVQNSVQVQEFNKEQEAKIKELEKWIETVKKDIEKQQTKDGKEKLFQKYKASYLEKKEGIIKSGQVKMQAFMDELSETIASEAKAKGYNMVITKGVVVYGGEDITEDVQNKVNAKANPTAAEPQKQENPAKKKKSIKFKK